nr:class I adenylate-forming enzyme family protein [Nocardia cyriacigeorgica]
MGIHLQNIPQYALVLLALWKLGAIALLLNPMYRGRELRELVTDAEPVGIITTNRDVQQVREDVDGTTVAWVLGTAESDLQSRNDPRVFKPETTSASDKSADLLTLAHEYTGRKPPTIQVHSDDLALLAYTSGTTGPPKGAMNSHANVRAVTTSFAELAGITPGDVVYALAPLFHITGAVVIGALALTERTSLVFTGRVTTDVAVDALREHGVTNTIGFITAFNAMMNSEYPTAEHFHHQDAVQRRRASPTEHGRPLPGTVRPLHPPRLQHDRNLLGSHGGPAGNERTVRPGQRDSAHRTTAARSERRGSRHRRPAPPSLQPRRTRGHRPHVISGYWHKPKDSSAALPEGRLRTGDGAIVGGQGGSTWST